MKSFFSVRIFFVIALLSGMLMIHFSCVKEQAIENKCLKLLDSRSTIQSLFSEFFDFSDNELNSIINTLLSIDNEKGFIETFLYEYGIPFWNHALTIKDKNDALYFIPLYNGKSANEINSFWLFYVIDNKMTYVPFKKTSDDNDAQLFICDLLSYRVFGKNNARGIVLKECTSQSRGWVTVEQCWDVWTGTEGNLTYQYTNCISKSYWVDEANYRTIDMETGGGSGSDVPIDNGSGGGTSSSGNDDSAGDSEAGSGSMTASDIFKGETLSEDSWDIINYMLNEILTNCLGENLVSQLIELLDGEKIEFKFIEGNNSAYNWNSKIFKFDIEGLDSDILLHELMHLYQTLTEPQSSFENSLLNREIEAHYAQYIYLSSQFYSSRKHKHGERWNSLKHLNNIIDDRISLREGYNSEILSAYIQCTLVPIFQKNPVYGSYSYDSQQEGTSNFTNINVLTKNCN